MDCTIPPSKSFKASPAISKTRTLSRRSASFLYHSDNKKSSTANILSNSLKAGKKVRHSIGYLGEKNDLAYKVVRSPYSLELKENRYAFNGTHKRKASQELPVQQESSVPLKTEDDSKENDCHEKEYNQHSPILRSRRFRRKAMKKSHLSSSTKQNRDNFQQRIARVAVNTVCAPSKSAVSEAEPKIDPERNSNELSSIDFSKIFSDCFTQDATFPVPTSVTSTTQTRCGLTERNENAPLNSNIDAVLIQADASNTALANCGLSKIDSGTSPIRNDNPNHADYSVAPIETTTRTNYDLSQIQNIAPTISDNDANNTFDSMFSCPDEELLACLCDDIETSDTLDTTSKQRSGTSGNLSSVNTSTNFPTKSHLNFDAIQFGGNENVAPAIGFQTASRKEIKISKTALQKAENILCFDCFGDPL